MKPTPTPLSQYHVFLASPGDVGAERQYVRRFFDEYNRHTAHIWGARFEVVDWENYSTVGVGRPQYLITQQTLEKYRSSLALVIGIMGQRFGLPTGMAESGTEEEFNWAMNSHKSWGFPEVKWFFRKVDTLVLPSDPDEAEAALDQWKKVRAFRKRMQDLCNPIFYAEYPSASEFAEVFALDLNKWLADPARPWAAEQAGYVATIDGAAAAVLPAEFNADRYRGAVLKRFDKLNFEMLDTTGALYGGVRLWSVFVPQSVRECHQYNPRLLEIPKEHQRRLLDAGEITARELEETEQQADRLRQNYFRQPLRPVLNIVDEALCASPAAARKLVILGDPGSGKSSLIRYLALRWAGIAEPTVRDTQPIPLVVELGAYSRWQCDGRKDFVRFLEEAPVWHEWPRGLLRRLIEQPGRIVLLLDGLDEVFDVPTRDSVINDIQRFSSQFANAAVVLTSRVVGYQPQRLLDADFRHFMLQDLASTQVTDFLHRWHEVTFDDPVQAAPKRDRLQKAIRNSKSIAMLAGNPLLLTMMAILNRNQELPRDRAELYSQASRVLLHQWDTERALEDFPGMSSEIGLREKTDILRRIAAHMQAAPGGLKGNMIDGPTLTELIEDYLRNELHFAQARAAARAVVEQLRQRNFILCFVGADSYAFVHRTFLEYFCAADFVYQFNVTKSLDIDGLIVLFDQHCRDDEWREVLRLICGQIDEQFVGRVVEVLADHTNLTGWDGNTPLGHLLLAILCLTEVRSTSRLEGPGVRVLQKTVEVARNAGPTGDAYPFLMEQLLPACREFGMRWPGGKILLGTHERREFSTAKEYSWGENFWPCLLGVVTGSRKVVRELADTKEGTREGGYYREAALQTLAEQWPDQTTRDLLAERAVQDDDDAPRSAALRALAEKWPDQTTRNLLAERAIQDKDSSPRRAALRAMAEQWPDQTTRDLLALSAVQHGSADTRSAALEALAEQWPDQTTRDLLAQRAVQDKDSPPRRAALRAMAEQWPDQTTRDLLAQSAVQHDNEDTRRAALEALAEQWPDQTTRGLLAQRAVQDDSGNTRSAALEALMKQWPDQTTRDLLAQRAIEDNHEDTRSAALEALMKQWPDQTTRDLLAQRAVEDNHEDTRSAALQAMAEKWPDQTTRDLLAHRAVQDDSENTRIAALLAMAEKWPDQATHEVLAQRAVDAPDISERGAACCILGKMHSRFGGILPTQDLDGTGPYLDPLKPIPRKHIKNAAAISGIRPDDIDAQLTSVSAHMGWDVTVGAKKKAVRKTGKIQRKK